MKKNSASPAGQRAPLLFAAFIALMFCALQSCSNDHNKAETDHLDNRVPPRAPADSAATDYPSGADSAR